MHSTSKGGEAVGVLSKHIGEVEVGTSTGSSGEAAQIADALISLIRIYSNIRARLASTADADVAPLFLLVKLVKDGPRRAKDLAELMCADQSTVSRQVAALVKTGLIRREADPEDGRASILVPTDPGERRVQEFLQGRGKAVEPIIGDWSAADRRQFQRLLQKYVATLEVRRDEVLNTMARGHATLHANHSENSSQSNARTERSS